ncbi:hypothetical protein EMIT0P43_10125 [Pseudomonas jessenii]
MMPVVKTGSFKSYQRTDFPSPETALVSYAATINASMIRCPASGGAALPAMCMVSR